MASKDVDDLFESRLLRKIPVDTEKVKNSLKIAENKLLRSKKLVEKDFFDESFLAAYTSMFHAARALLYCDGIQEKSHHAVYVYLREKYKDKLKIKLVESFKSYQLERHNILYRSIKEISSEEARHSITDANDFLLEAKKILENEKNF
ncbi:HEPN domain-containing protein [Candidatus Pacearchaeota archaeon]|nr:HEPN domain-containing protein [Candidatus Pacearchaeota archaeon]